MNHSNVVKDPMNDFNACDDFFDVVISGHIIAVQNLWMCSEDDRRSALDKSMQGTV